MIGAVWLAGCSGPEETEPAPVVQVKVARAGLADVPLEVEAPATIFPRAQAKVASKITAPIWKLAVQKGDSVRKGELLAELENRDLEAQKRKAAAAVTAARAALEKISAGTLPTDVERARGQVATAEAALNQAEKIYDRRKQLFEQGAIPRRQLLVSETQLAQAKTAYQVARKALEFLESHSREKDIQMARSRLEQAKAELSFVQAQLEFTRIRSPFRGVVTEQFLYPGDMATPNSPIFTVMDLGLAVARAQVPEENATAVRVGQSCTFIPQDAPGTSYGGRVTVVNRAVDPARRTVESWCEIPNGRGALRAGVFGTARIRTGVAHDSVVVPLEAVQFEEGTRRGVVLVAGDDHRAVEKKVEAGVTFDGKVQILDGVKAGERVVIEGGYGLPSGTQVRWTEGEASR